MVVRRTSHSLPSLFTAPWDWAPPIEGCGPCRCCSLRGQIRLDAGKASRRPRHAAYRLGGTPWSRRRRSPNGRTQRECPTPRLCQLAMAAPSYWVRDEEAAGSNPVTPTSITAGQRPAAPCDKVRKVADVSDLLADFGESKRTVVYSLEHLGGVHTSAGFVRVV
jgi:hypothetical protein